MSHARLLALALATTALAASGCGESATKSSIRTNPTGGAASSIAESSAPAGPLTRAELIAAADPICKRLTMRVHTVYTTTLPTVGTTAPTLTADYNTTLVELRKLTPPASMKSAWRAILADFKSIAHEVTVMGRFATDNDIRSTVRVEEHIGKVQRHRFAVARHAGFVDCAEL